MTTKVVYDLNDNRWLQNVGGAENTVVLTFDDGPGRHLNGILDILKHKEVPAMFFWQSRLVHHRRPWKRCLDEGHVIGSHAHNHSNLSRLNREKQWQQLKGSKDQLESVTGEKVLYFRPPFGQYNEDTMAVLNELQLIPVMWELSSYDWELKCSPEKIVCNVVNHIRPGTIILLHELPQTVAVLSQLIDGVREKGYEFTLI
ncbi:MAG: polysaccharide deacetylase family protein [Bacillus sp. (in: Bacteria)]|nr:polysaccharide deacetylase family protein [Bacillus sp. (in: firmicutes)]